MSVEDWLSWMEGASGLTKGEDLCDNEEWVNLSSNLMSALINQIILSLSRSVFWIYPFYAVCVHNGKGVLTLELPVTNAPKALGSLSQAPPLYAYRALTLSPLQRRRQNSEQLADVPQTCDTL